MEGKESICKILRSITEVEMAMDRDLLLDYVMGRPTQIISQKGLDNTEQYGCGDEKDEEHWTVVVEKCIEEGFLKIHTDGIKVTAKGKKYLKKPTSIELSDAEEEEVTIEENVPLVEDEDEVIKEKKIPKATNSQRKRALIQAVDRHVALDDFATNHGLDFDEVMDDMEGIIASGMKLDLKYFGYEVLGKEAMDELFEYFDSAETDNMEKAIDEYGDVYNREELRLGRILWRAEKL